MKLTRSEIITTFVIALTITPTFSKSVVYSKDWTDYSSSSFDKKMADELSVKLTNDLNVVGTCLVIEPDLPPCRFDDEANWNSRSGEILQIGKTRSRHAASKVPKIGVDVSDEEDEEAAEISTDDTGDEFSSEEYDLAVTVVYHLEGCLPSRLPFDLPACGSIDDSKTVVRTNRLVPFKLLNDGYENVAEPHIFPEVDLDEIESSRNYVTAG